CSPTAASVATRSPTSGGGWRPRPALRRRLAMSRHHFPTNRPNRKEHSVPTVTRSQKKAKAPVESGPSRASMPSSVKQATESVAGGGGNDHPQKGTEKPGGPAAAELQKQLDAARAKRAKQ